MPPRLRALTVRARPEAWVAAGFELRSGSTQVGQVEITVQAEGARRGVREWCFETDAAVTDPTEPIDGIPTRWVPRRGAPPPAVEHPNGATLLDHVVVLSPHLKRTTEAITAVGLDVRRVREVPTGYPLPSRQVFFRSGESVIELIGPVEPDPARLDRPARLWGLAFTVDDLDALADRLGDHLGRPKEAVQPGRRIATVREEAGLGAAVAFMTPGPAAS